MRRPTSWQRPLRLRHRCARRALRCLVLTLGIVLVGCGAKDDLVRREAASADSPSAGTPNAGPPSGRAAADGPPNFVVIFADDLGWGDLSSFGHPAIKTPHLDRMASEGQKWTNFYVASPVCSPSRGALLTGRLPVRSGLFGRHRIVLFPGDEGGMPQSEVTVAEALRDVGYATGMVGKWHLGDHPGALPLDHGFDSWFGIPYSNDMDWTIDVSDRAKAGAAYFSPKVEYWDVPLYRNADVVERPADQTTITKRYGDEAASFIRAHREQPFFLYLAHSMPHMPLFRSPEFEGRSAAGAYGDVIEEIDATVGQVLDTLKAEGLDQNTVVVFTSDNGPWILFDHHGGSAGPLQDGKATTWEGGVRVPGVFWGPGLIEPGVVGDMGSTLDLLPTLVALAGGEAPDGVALDGFDLSPVFSGAGPSPRTEMPFYRYGDLYAYRQGAHKVHFTVEGAYGEGPPRTDLERPRLYHLGQDIGERWDLSEREPGVLKRLVAAARAHEDSFSQAEPIFDLGHEPPAAQ